ncbi:MAG TPA: hypothetical protein VGE74_05880 [Gemmata sp.]
MSAYIVIDTDEPQFVASNHGWGAFCAWVDTLDHGQFGDLVHFREHGWTEPAATIRRELTAAIRSQPPGDPDTRDVAQEFLAILTRAPEDAVVIASNGVVAADDSPGDDAAEDDSSEEPDPDAFGELSDDDLATFAARKEGETWVTGNRRYTYQNGKTTWESVNKKADTKKSTSKGKGDKVPPKPKPDPVQAAAEVRAQLGGDHTKLTPTAVKELAEKLGSLTVPEIKKIKDEHDLKGGRTKAEHIAKLLDRARELKKEADKKRRQEKKTPVPAAPVPAVDPPMEPDRPSGAPPEPEIAPPEQPKEAPASHPLRTKLVAAVNASPNLTDEQRQRFAGAVERVVKSIPKMALDRMADRVSDVTFHPATAPIGQACIDALASKPGLTEEQRAVVRSTHADLAKQNIGGAYIKSLRQLHVDGDHLMKYTRSGKYESQRAMPSDGVYAHELGHALDGPDNEITKSDEWRDVFASEIAYDVEEVRKRKAAPRLTEYAGTKPSEGFAEFTRLVYGSDVPHDQIAREFPKATALFKSRGWWPETERAGSSRGLLELFAERVPLGADEEAGHADVLQAEPQNLPQWGRS